MEWKQGIERLADFVGRYLETFLVEWKRMSRTSLIASQATLETFLVEWKRYVAGDAGATAFPLKPS